MIKLPKAICYISRKFFQVRERAPDSKRKLNGGLLVELIFALFIGAMGCVVLFGFCFFFLTTELKIKKDQLDFLSTIDCMNFIINEIVTRKINNPTVIFKKDRSYFFFLTKVDNKEKVVGYYAYKDKYGVSHIKRFASSDEKLREKLSTKEKVSEGYLRKRIDGWNTIYDGKSDIEFQLKNKKMFVIKVGKYFRSCIFE
ncbi:MAG: hypothetical protein J7K69_01125 [Thermotogae bacterium]|nr:hypothetical protein [Thermotogota bacterium]